MNLGDFIIPAGLYHAPYFCFRVSNHAFQFLVNFR